MPMFSTATFAGPAGCNPAGLQAVSFWKLPFKEMAERGTHALQNPLAINLLWTRRQFRVHRPAIVVDMSAGKDVFHTLAQRILNKAPSQAQSCGWGEMNLFSGLWAVSVDLGHAVPTASGVLKPCWALL